jgi:hypothetical protein
LRTADALLRVAAALIAAATLLAAAPVLAQNAATSKFDHDPTGFPLTGTHVSIPCASCHINARFKTTPRNCFGCHNGMTAPGAASLLGAHPITTNYCEGCHQTTTWRDYRFIDHVQALGPCAACHNGKVAVGKTPQHPITNAPCNTCHFNTVTFKGGILPPATPATATTPAATTTTTPAATTPAPANSGTAPSQSPNRPTSTPQPPTGAPASSGVQTSSSMRNASGKPNHAGFVSGCATCHNGAAAMGKKPNHIVTTAPCETCHRSTVTFAGARMNHAGLVANCGRCHNGAVATGKPAKHIVTAAPCETCHKSTMMFAGARVDHASLTGACATCHNGVTAEGRPRQHVMTTAPCDTCHRTSFWTPATFRHVSPAFVDHGPGVGCQSCHAGNAQTAAWKFPAFRPGCAGCHAQQYRPMAHVKFERPAKVYYTVSELRDCTGSCHTYTDSTMRTIVTRSFSRHRAIGGGW